MKPYESSALLAALSALVIGATACAVDAEDGGDIGSKRRTLRARSIAAPGLQLEDAVRFQSGESGADADKGASTTSKRRKPPAGSADAYSLHLEDTVRFKSVEPNADADRGRALFGVAADLQTETEGSLSSRACQMRLAARW